MTSQNVVLYYGNLDILYLKNTKFQLEISENEIYPCLFTDTREGLKALV